MQVHAGDIETASGREIPFDSLIIALGARREAAFRQALTFRDLTGADSSIHLAA